MERSIHWSGATGRAHPDPDQDVVIPAFSGQSVIVTLDTPAVINSISITGDSLLNTTTLALGDNMISVISEDSLAFSLTRTPRSCSLVAEFAHRRLWWPQAPA